MFLSFDELPEDERPPERIWLVDEELKAHFDRVKADREQKYGGGDKHIDDPVQNDAASLLVTG